MTTGLGGLGRLRRVETRSISPENFDGARGGGGRPPRGPGHRARRTSDGLEDLAPAWWWLRARRSRWPPSTVRAGSPTCGSPPTWTTGAGLVLRAYWDGADEPAVEVPFGDFFCSGWGRFAQVSSQPVAANPNGGFNSYWPMPFRSGARLTVENPSEVPVTVYYQVTYEMGEDHADRRLPPRPVAPQQSAGRRVRTPSSTGSRAAATTSAPTSPGASTPRLVGRGRDQVLPRRRRRLPDDLRHRHRGLLRRRLELRRPRSGLHRVLDPVPRACRR